MGFATRDQVEQRLLDNRMIDPATGCWNWTRSCQGKGYGQTSFQGHNLRVHRLAAHFWLGFDLSGDLLVLHHCDNPPCFNPDHLWFGTPADNTADMVTKGRWGNKAFPGESNSQHVVTERQVIEIRKKAEDARRVRGTYRRLAREYGVSHDIVRRIVARQTWRHV